MELRSATDKKRIEPSQNRNEPVMFSVKALNQVSVYHRGDTARIFNRQLRRHGVNLAFLRFCPCNEGEMWYNGGIDLRGEGDMT